MRKTLLKSLFVAGMLAMGMNASAQTLAEGKYYLQNVGTSLWWGCGNDWGTRGSLMKHAEYVILLPQEDGTYQMETQVSNGGTSYYFGGDYMDGSPMNLTFAVDGGYFTVADPSGKLFGYDGASTILGKDVALGDNAYWLVISHEEKVESLAVAKVTDPVDATFLILDPNFGRNNRNSSAWEGTGLHQGGDNVNMNTESYMATFDVHQTLSGVPNGVYKVDAQAAVTYHDNRTVKEYDGEGAPVIYANDESSDFNTMIASDQLTSQGQLSSQFTNGNYQVESIFFEVTDNTITLGAKCERNDIWAVWDNFELTYFGSDCTVEQAQNAALFAELTDLRNQVELLIDQVEVDAVKEALQAALEATANVGTKAEAEAAIATLTEAVNQAKASIKAKDILPLMESFLETTNFYTEEALDEYYYRILDRYEDGTLTIEEANSLQDPNSQLGWHAANRVDDLLLSVWSIGGEQCANYDKALYINTWSVEGNSDGSEFRVPFFEYWTGDASSLAANQLTATLTEMNEGVYDIKGWIRVRIKNDGGDSASGITMQVNDGDVVDVTTGAQVGTSQFRLGEFSARGEVGTDGELKVTFDVAADNNISWLSFKNMWYELNETVTGISEATTAQQSEKAVFNLQGQRVEKATKGLFIVNGKKVLK